MYRKNRFICPVLALMVLFIVSGCEENSNSTAPEPNTQIEQIDWSSAANHSTEALIFNFWNGSGNYWKVSTDSQVFAYWTGAHATEVIIDAYLRTDEAMYKTYINNWYSGVLAEMNGTFINDYYDDMEWNALALLRAYKVTGEPKFKQSVDELWTNIKTGWTDVGGGGIMWAKHTPKSKNAISNSPASILASRLYQLTGTQEYLDWSKKTYLFTKNNLVDPNSGAVWDNLKVQDDGSIDIQKDWVFTYNQGVFLGAGLELYEITGEQIYLDDAIKAADHTLNSLVNINDGILKDEGDGDGGLFKGIFVRYFTQLILEEDLPESDRNRYVKFLEHNANTLWTEGTNSSTLYSSYWKDKPGPYEQVDQSVETSGSILIEAAALLQKKNVLPYE